MCSSKSVLLHDFFLKRFVKLLKKRSIEIILCRLPKIVALKCASQLDQTTKPNFHFSVFPIFAVKLGHIIKTTFFSYVTNTQAYQRKTEKFFVSEEIKFGRIDS